MTLDPETVRRLTAHCRPASQPTTPQPRPVNVREEVIDGARAGESVKDTAVRLGIPQRTVLYYRSNSGPVKFPVALTCPHCGTNGWHEVIDSRCVPGGDYIRRRRECACGKRFTTEERVKL